MADRLEFSSRKRGRAAGNSQPDYVAELRKQGRPEMSVLDISLGIGVLLLVVLIIARKKR